MLADFILPFVRDHGILISFLGGFITGETAILFIAFLSATGSIPLWQVLVFCTLGMYLSDFIPLTIGRFKLLRNIFEGKRFSKHLKKAEFILSKYTRHNLFLTILYSKVIYGASIPTLIYLGYKKTSYLKFALYNLLVEIIFVPTVVLIGWFGGSSYKFVSTLLRDIRITILLLIVFVFLLIFIRKWIDKELIRRQKRLI